MNAMVHSRPAGKRSAHTLRHLPLRCFGIVCVVALSACTTVGTNTKEQGTIDFGPPVTIRLCLLKSESVTAERVDELIAAVNEEFKPYAIDVVVPWVRPWTRPGFTSKRIMDEIKTRPLEPPCDRLVGLVDRNLGDVLWGLTPFEEIFGAVELATHTHGFVVATAGSIKQIVYGAPPQVTVHEFYHLLGCRHGLTLSKCYHEIADIKTKIVPEADFFPGVTKDGEFLTTREAVNAVLLASIATDESPPRAASAESASPQSSAPTSELDASPP